MYSGASPVVGHDQHPVGVAAQVVHGPGQRAQRREHLVRHRPGGDVAADHHRAGRIGAQLGEHRLEGRRVAVDVAEHRHLVGHGAHRTRSLDTDHRLFMIGHGGPTRHPERGERYGHEPGRRGAGHVLRVRRLPDRVAGGREGAVLDPRRPALPEPGVPAVLRHRGLVAHLRPHVPPLRHPVRVGLDRQERQRLRLHGGRPREPGDPGGGDGVRGRLRPARAPRPGLRRADRRLPGLGAPRLRGELPGLVAQPPAPRARAQLRAPGHLRHREREPPRPRDPARGRDRRPRPRVEDPLDAQLRAVLLDHGAQRDDRGGPRRGRPRADGPAAVLRRGPQLGLGRGPLEDEGGDRRRRRSCARSSRAARRPRTS